MSELEELDIERLAKDTLINLRQINLELKREDINLDEINRLVDRSTTNAIGILRMSSSHMETVHE